MDSNGDLVDYLVAAEKIESEKVEKAFRAVDRARFVPDKYSTDAYSDRPLPIGEEATISAPHMVAINTELLEPQDSDRVLEIGSGSGYQAAILSEIVSEFVGVEISPDLVEKSREMLGDRENIEITQGDGFKPVEEKFDKILFSAATDSIEEAKNYLNEEGIIVAPVSQNGSQILQKYQDGEVTEHGRVSFVEMV